MTIFKLPDLGEGLPDAEIHEWYIKAGDDVIIDQPLVAMETAKAIVDVPSPYTGKINKLYGNQGDIIKTHDPLILFNLINDDNTQHDNHCSSNCSSSTVVGNLEESNEIKIDNFSISNNNTIKTTPLIRTLAKKLNVDLQKIIGTGAYGVITRTDVETAAQTASLPVLDPTYTSLRGARRAMLNSMMKSHQTVVPVSLFDEVDINAWEPNTDITIRLIQAIIAGCTQEPVMNSWFDTKHNAIKLCSEINLGLAIDSSEGLFVPVLHNIAQLSAQDLRTTIEIYKNAVQTRTLATDKLSGATISLSNFGKFAGRFASPIIIPPQVAILAVGKLYRGVVADNNNTIQIHNLLPLSLTFDHRAITGGEASRFLHALMQSLKQP